MLRVRDYYFSRRPVTSTLLCVFLSALVFSDGSWKESIYTELYFLGNNMHDGFTIMRKPLWRAIALETDACLHSKRLFT